MSSNQKSVFQSTSLVWSVSAFLAGIVIANIISDLIMIAVGFALVSVAGFAICRKRLMWTRFFMITLALSGGMIHHYRANTSLPANQLKRYFDRMALDEFGKIDLCGTVVTSPIINRPEKMFPYHSAPDLSSRFLFEACELRAAGKSFSTVGLVFISIPGVHDQFTPGQRVEISGRLFRPRCEQTSYDLPCLKRCYSLKNSAISARMFVSTPDQVQIIDETKFSFSAIKTRLQAQARYCLFGDDSPASDQSDDLLSAIILGKKNQMENELNQSLMRIGASHFLAVSGFHLVVLSFGVWFLGAVFGFSRPRRAMLVIGCVLVYAMVTDFRPSVVRAAIMMIVFCGGMIINKPVNNLNALALSAGIMVLINPNQIFTPGFQLSFIAALGLIRLSKPFHLALFGTKIPGAAEHETRPVWLVTYHAVTMLKLLLAVSLAAFLATLPLAMYYFGRFSVVGPIASMLLYPFVTLLVLAGFAQLVLGIFSTVLAWPVSMLTNCLSIMMAKISIWFGSLPCVSFDVPAPAWYLVFAYLLLLFMPKLRFRKLLILLVVSIYLSFWLLDSERPRTWIYAAGTAEGQTTIVNTGSQLVMVNCGGYRVGQSADLMRKVSSYYLASPTFAICSSSDDDLFNEAWTQASMHSRMEFLIPDSFKTIAHRNEPVKLLVSDENLNKRFISNNTTICIDDTQFNLLLPPDLRMADSAFARSEAFKSGAVLVSQNDDNVLIISHLNELGCGLLEMNYPDLRVDTLVLVGSVATDVLEAFILRVGVSKICVQGKFRGSCCDKLEEIARRCHCKLKIAETSAGFLVNTLEE